MNTQEVTGYIQHIEEKYNLLQYQIDGWATWPLFRYSISSQLRKLPRDNMTTRYQWRLDKRIQMSIKDLLTIPFLHSSRYIVIASSLNRRLEENGYYKDVYFDDFLLAIKAFIKIEHTHSKQFSLNSRQAVVPSNLTTNFILLPSLLLAKIRYPIRIQKVAQQIFNILTQENLNLPLPVIVKKMRTFFWSKRLYKQLFRKLHPQHLLLINAYGDYALVAAAKELHIQITEFQHGFLDRHHIGYSWTQYALPYKRYMPVPDNILLYGDYWKNELMVNHFWSDELYAVGSLHIDLFRRKQIRRNDICTITITTQNLEQRRLIHFLKNFLDIANKNHLPCKIYIKLHQSETDSSIYTNSLINYPHIHIITASQSPSTFTLIKRSHFHVSIFSTCHYESIALNTPTIILPFTGYENVVHLYKEGHAFLAQTPIELFTIISGWRNVAVDTQVGNYYFKYNALQNIKSILYD